MIDLEWLVRQDEHICRQENDVTFDDILWLEDLPECFERPKRLNMHFECTKENLKLLGHVIKVMIIQLQN